MRLVYALVPEGRREAVFELLDELGADYIVNEEVGRGGGVVVQFPIPTPAVEEVLQAFSELDFDEEYIVVTAAEAARTKGYDVLEARFVDESDEETIAFEEIRSRTVDMTPKAVTYYSMTVLSAIVAASGLLLNSAAVVVGSMVIAPQIGAIMTASVGTVLNDRRMIRQGLTDQLFGLALAVISAVAFGYVVHTTDLLSPAADITAIEEVSQRISPGVLAVTVAAAAGAAGAFGLATALPISLVGVMVAAALIPAAAAVGLGVAWGLPAVAVGALVLLVLNTTAINVTAIGMLRYFGYRPGDRTPEGDVEEGSRLQFWPAAAAIVVLVAAFAGTGFAMMQQVSFEDRVADEVNEALAQPPYDRLELTSVRAEYAVPPLDRTRTVTVVVNGPDGAAAPDLATTLDRRIEARTGESVVVEVEFVRRDRSTSGR